MGEQALITASATRYPLSLARGSLWRTEGSRRYLDCSKYGRKHRPGFLPKKPLRRGRPVRTREEKVVHGGEACTLAGVVKSAPLMIPPREVSVAPFDMGAGALEHLRKLGCLGFELVLLQHAALVQRPAGLKEWGPEAFGQCA